MPRLVIAPRALEDIDTILTWTWEEFGEDARNRYAALIDRAIDDVANDPFRIGSKSRPEIATDVRTYHLNGSRNRVTKSIGRVKKPRHFLLYRVRAEFVVVGRLLYDGMDLESQLPPGYEVPSPNT